jgi:hypothetical protein
VFTSPFWPYKLRVDLLLLQPAAYYISTLTSEKMRDEMESGTEPVNSIQTSGPDASLGQISLTSSLVEFVETLESIDTTSPLAKLNETTISDNNGGRIEL